MPSLSFSFHFLFVCFSGAAVIGVPVDLTESTVWQFETPSGLGIEVDSTTHQYSISVRGQVWLESHTDAAYAFRASNKWHSLSPSSTASKLSFVSSSQGDSADALGAFEWLSLSWKTSTNENSVAADVPFETLFKVYRDASAVSFVQRFPHGANDTSVGTSSEVITSFPAFDAGTPEIRSKQSLTWTGLWSPGEFNDNGLDSFTGGGSSSVPLVIFDGQARDAIVVSPRVNFKSGSLVREKNWAQDRPLSCGISGMVEMLPHGFEHETIITYGGAGHGVKGGLYTWGEALLTIGNKTKDCSDDLVSSTLGYYTDNGAFYYDRTEGDIGSGSDYAKTLVDIKKQAAVDSVPYTYMQLDSWWYTWGPDHGVANWAPRNDAMTFPNGSFPQGLGPLQLHNRFFSNTTAYSRHGVSFNVSHDGGVGLGEAFPIDDPHNLKQLYDDLMAQGKALGMVLYEQDWMVSQYGGMSYPQLRANRGDDWLRALGAAALDADVRVLFCMPLPSDYLASSMLPSVRHIRVSDDYWAYLKDFKPTWDIALNTLLADSLGLYPSKDVFWTVETNKGYARNGPAGSPVPVAATEPNPSLALLSALLSGGQVAPGDAMTQWDAGLMARAHDKTGRLVRGDVPLTPVESWLSGTIDGGRAVSVSSSYAEVSGVKYVYVLAARGVWAVNDTRAIDVKLDVKDLLGHTAIPTTMAAMTMEVNTATGVSRANTAPVVVTPAGTVPLVAPSTAAGPAGRVPYALVLVAPVLNGWALVGERDFTCSVTSSRTTAVEVTGNDLRITILSAVGETMVSVTAWYNEALAHGNDIGASDADIVPNGWRMYTATCPVLRMSASQSVTVTITSSGSATCAEPL